MLTTCSGEGKSISKTQMQSDLKKAKERKNKRCLDEDGNKYKEHWKIQRGRVESYCYLPVLNYKNFTIDLLNKVILS